MSEEASFLRAVCASPDDDGPRLVFADWLDELGDPRGSFIRLQLKLARYRWEDSRRPAWERRADELWDKHGARWLAALPRLPEVNWVPPFCRGFLERASSIVPAFLAHADEWSPIVPIQKLDLNVHFSGPEQFEALVNDPHLVPLRELSLDGVGYLNAPLGTLAESRFLTRLRRLRLFHAGARAVSGLTELLASSALPALQGLILHGTREFGAGVVEILTTTPAAARLTELHLSGCALDDADVRRLAACPHLSGLRVLSLLDNRLTDEGAYWLAHSSVLRGLTRLFILGGNQFSNTARRMLQKGFGKAVKL